MIEGMKKQAPGEFGDTQGNVEQLRKRITVLWVAVVALAVVLSGAAAYGTLALHKHNIQLQQLPGMQETLALAGKRLDAAETRLADWAADWTRLEDRLDKLGRQVAYNREAARAEAQKLAAQVEERLRAEMAAEAQAVEARLGQIESTQATDQARLDGLTQEVAAVREDTGRELARLDREVSAGGERVEEMARTLERQRVDFELARNLTQEVAPGVSLHVSKTDVGHQRIGGLVWLSPDAKTLWVRSLGIQQPLVFRRKDGGGPHELVITTVTRDSVAGYVLLPVGSPAGEAAAGSAGGPESGRQGTSVPSPATSQ